MGISILRVNICNYISIICEYIIDLFFIFNFCSQFIALVLICVAVYAKVSAKITSLPILGGVIACGVFLLLVAIMGVVGAIRHSQVILFFVSFLFLNNL